MMMSSVNENAGEPKWLLYGAYGYTGELIARECPRQGLRPVLAGRSAARLAPLAAELGLEHRVFALDDAALLARELAGVQLVLNCAGPFSATAAPMMEACLAASSDYLDITGEIDVLEHAQSLSEAAARAGIVICCGVGFDVIPTDCVAATLVAAMPDATHLALGFDSRSGLSPGTAKTTLKRLGAGSAVRDNGRIVSVPLASRTRRIDFGAGEKLAMCIPWGDVATAWYTTGIANIEVYVPASPRLISRLHLLNALRPLLRLAPVQAFARGWITRALRGPGAAERARTPTRVWGEVRNAAGACSTARVDVANGYDLTVSGALAVTRALLAQRRPGGSYTPARLMGPDFVCTLPGSSGVRIE
jgi:short subunit dehydrogenase-like uncharacterized protein